jgi:oligopeptide/dipeptide ABC transporter ATP-binding protein
MIKAEGIRKTFPARGGLLAQRAVQALRGVDLEIPEGGAVSLIGESGCGKTTLGRILAGLETLDAGRIVIDDTDVTALPVRARQPYFRRIQLIHQDPYSALNPARTVGEQLSAPLGMMARRRGLPRDWTDQRAVDLLELVGLDRDTVYKYPHQLSGGQRQRVVVARALTVDPDVLVADEAVSMIDVSLRLGILGLLRELRRELHLAVLFITHDVAAARYIGQDGRIHVIYKGTVVESGPTDQVIESPVHPYTQALLSALPVLRGLEQPGPDRFIPRESLESEQDESRGCLFAPRCPFREARCASEPPPLVPWDNTGRRHACFVPAVRRVVAEPIETEAGEGA